MRVTCLCTARDGGGLAVAIGSLVSRGPDGGGLMGLRLCGARAGSAVGIQRPHETGEGR